MSLYYLYAVTINLSADAQPIPGGYVVPEGGNVTFTCNSSLGGISWTLDLKVPGGTAELTASAGLARSIPQVSSPDTMPSANPATITIHNVTSENNQSTVQCSDPITGTEASSARVIVEGKRLNTTLYIYTQALIEMGYKVTVSVKYVAARMYMPEWGMLHSSVEVASLCNCHVWIGDVSCTQYHADHYRYRRVIYTVLSLRPRLRSV